MQVIAAEDEASCPLWLEKRARDTNIVRSRTFKKHIGVYDIFYCGWWKEEKERRHEKHKI